MEQTTRPGSLPLFGPMRKDIENGYFVTWTIDTVVSMFRSRFETRRQVATMSARWLREHEVDDGKRG